MIYRLLLGGLAMAGLVQPACAYDVKAKVELDPLISKHARANDVPAALVHRIILRESRYNARAVGRGGTFGLMQIKHATARALGYSGAPEGLLDPDTNLTYGVRYLAGAYRVADGDQNRAVGYFARGYYYDAKRRGMLRALAQRPTAVEEPPAAPAPPVPPQAPSLFTLLFAPPVQTPQEATPPVGQPRAEDEPASAPSPKRGPRSGAGHAAAGGHGAGTEARRAAGLRGRPPAVADRHRASDEMPGLAEEEAAPEAPVRRSVRPAKRAGAVAAGRSGQRASAQPDDPGRSP
jgi:hypothetical protein